MVLDQRYAPPRPDKSLVARLFGRARALAAVSGLLTVALLVYAGPAYSFPQAVPYELAALFVLALLVFSCLVSLSDLVWRLFK